MGRLNTQIPIKRRPGSLHSSLQRETGRQFRDELLDPEYAPAMFELGGVHWNSGDQAKAKQAWSVACERFPDHELVSQVKALLQ